MSAHCPECNSIRVRVVVTAPASNDSVVRRRKCLVCDHRWYTVQTPEQLLPQDQLQWFRVGNQNKVKVIASQAA